MYLEEQIQKHVNALPIDLKNEVLDFVLFLEHKLTQQEIKANNVHAFIKPILQQQEHFAESLLNPGESNEKLIRSAQTYKENQGNT